MLEKLKEYFIGDLLRKEKDTIRYANIEVVFYVTVLALAVQVPLTIVYLINGYATELVVVLITTISFLVFLVQIRRTGNIQWVSHGILLVSTGTLTVNLFMYPVFNLIQGILLCCSLLFAFNLIQHRVAWLYVVWHLIAVLGYIFMFQNNITIPFIKPVTQSTSVLVLSYLILFAVFLLLILHYMRAHQASARRLAESLQEIQISERGKRKAQAIVRMGSWRYEIRKKTIVWDEDAYRLFGVDPSVQVTRDMFLAVVHPDDREAVARVFQQAVIAGDYIHEYRSVASSGELKYFVSWAQVDRDEQGEALAMYGFTQDITDLRKTELELKELLDVSGYQNTQLKNFTYIVSHNIRAHSANIRSLLDFMESSKDEAE